MRRFGVAVLCANVALVPLAFDYSADFPFVIPKALLGHGLAYILAATIAGLFLQYGRALFVHSSLHIPVLAYLVASVASAIVAADPVLALYGTHARMLGLASVLDFVVLYFGVALLVRTRLDAFVVGASTLAASVVVLAYELLQVTGRDPLQWSIDGAARPFSTIGESTALAQYLVVLAVGALAVGLLVARLRGLERGAVLVMAALLLVGAIATGTRAALIGLATGGAVLVLLVWLLHPSARARAASLIGVVALTTTIAAALVLTPLGARISATIVSPSISDDEDLISRLEPSAAGRVVLFQMGLDMVRQRPVFGYGPDNFVAAVPANRPERAPVPFRESPATSPHSWVLQVASSSGLVGLACFLAIAIVAFRLVIRRGFRSGAVVSAVILAAFLGTGSVTPNEFGTDWLFWVGVGGIAAATGHVPGRYEGIEPTARRPGRQWVRRDDRLKSGVAVFLVLAAIGAALVGTNALDASRSARSSKDARLVGRSGPAVELGLRAIRSDPGRAEYWHTLGLAYVATSNWREATAALDRASTLAPYDARYLGDLATAQLILARTGDVSARGKARDLGERAVRIDPNNPSAQLTRAVVMQALNDLPEALRSVQRALALDPNSVNLRLYITATQVLVASGRADEAVELARDGLVVFGPTRTSVPLRIELANALVATGQARAAIAELDLALVIQPNEPTAERLRATIRATLPDK